MGKYTVGNFGGDISLRVRKGFYQGEGWKDLGWTKPVARLLCRRRLERGVLTR